MVSCVDPDPGSAMVLQSYYMIENYRSFVNTSIFSAEYWGVYRMKKMVVKNIALSDPIDCSRFLVTTNEIPRPNQPTPDPALLNRAEQIEYDIL